MEIQALLNHHQTPDLAADALIKKYENKKLSLHEFETIGTFLLYCGFYATLSDLILRKLNDDSQIPWGHFAEAIFLSLDEVPPAIKKALLEGAEENSGFSHLARSHFLDEYEPDIRQQRELRRQEFLDRGEKRKSDLLQELEILKSQGLFNEEEKVLKILTAVFPQNPEIGQLKADLRERMAQEYMIKRVPRPRKEIFFPTFEKKSPEEESLLREIEKSMRESLHGAQHMAIDFALSHLFWENYEAALRILQEEAPPGPETDWLKAEVLLRGRRFVELLNELLILEERYAADTETIFAIHYLRAQALWGLEQKHRAIEILEGMVETRPQYRAAMTLLKEWKEDFI